MPTKPRELTKRGLMGKLSVFAYEPDRDVIDKALGKCELSEPQQGGVGALQPGQRMPNDSGKSAGDGSSVSGWVDPF